MLQHVVKGQTEIFYARCYDDDNELFDPDNIEAFLLEPGEAYPGVWLTVTRSSEGIYGTTVSIPASATSGTWSIYWRIDIGDETYTESEEFEVQASADLFFDSEVLMINQEYTILIQKEIKDTYGNTLMADTEIFFYTEFDPYYASVEEVRLLAGGELEEIPDYTIALQIWKASMYADKITYRTIDSSCETYWEYYKFARSQFVASKVALELLKIVEQKVGGGYKKQLADLSISRFGRSGNMKDDLLDDLAKELKGWKWVIQNGGRVAPETGHRPGVAVKAGWHPNRPNIGRGWITNYEGSGGANTKTVSQPVDDDSGTSTRAKRVKVKYANWDAAHGR